MPGAPRVVGILAGAGTLPREIADEVRAGGGTVHIVAIEGEADSDFAGAPSTRVGWAETGGMLRALRNAGCSELVIVGAVRRPDLAKLRPDLGFFVNLPGIARLVLAGGGDDSVLGKVVRFFESKGLKVVSPAHVAPGLLVGEGPIGARQATASDMLDVMRGFSVVRALAPFDVGQAVVVTQGQVEAIEAAENTDAMLARVALRRGRQSEGTGPRRGVLVKRPKPGQEMRVDLPAIGPATVDRALAAGLSGIAVLAGATLAAARAELIRRADAGGLFIVGACDRGAPAAAATTASIHPAFMAARGKSAPRQVLADATRGAAVLRALETHCASRGVVVDRSHVLAIECGEGVANLLARAGALRQWGQRNWRRRSAIAVVSGSVAGDIGAVIGTAAASGIAGLAVVGGDADALAHAADTAGRQGLWLIASPPSPGGPA